MPPKRGSLPLTPCTHTHLLTTPLASQTQFSRISPSRRAAATTSTGTRRAAVTDASLSGFASEIEFASTFPGPLVLEGDDLATDPKQTGQTFRGWKREKQRNLVPSESPLARGKEGRGARRIIYVVGPPGVDGEGVEGFMRGWDECEIKDGGEGKRDRNGRNIRKEKCKTNNWIPDVISYLQAFYHGLPVKQLDSSLLHFTPWEDAKPKLSHPNSQSKSKTRSQKILPANKSTPIGLRTSTFKTCIRARSTPSAPFSHQLNLSDLLDVAIDILPEDAYAVLMLVKHDLYEDDDDEFICGRAYGESRVAVVSTARYDPGLDRLQRVERVHAWPGSHCVEYMGEMCGVGKGGKRKRKRESVGDEEFAVEGSPLVQAVKLQNTLVPLSPNPSLDALKGLYLSRICRTASHELGHCFGIDHCIYYACCMQGSASIIEDARQPPYLCPIDLAKVVKATGADVKERYEVLLDFCTKHGDAHMFVAFGEWIRARLGQTELLNRLE
ncbi:hypothetical protein SBOR_4944 [Sclerotinia borealis F-4128]|uniref:Uncharacterized protein n=1 Tax=Sclerotinia borealis (strain F-4128) TaxID=1432307 RepID=W9CFK4_SCLBF|nr:hypothetical protein SBOR_4944 [Sclerotinia borealis F-4128]